MKIDVSINGQRRKAKVESRYGRVSVERDLSMAPISLSSIEKPIEVLAKKAQLRPTLYAPINNARCRYLYQQEC